MSHCQHHAKFGNIFGHDTLRWVQLHQFTNKFGQTKTDRKNDEHYVLVLSSGQQADHNPTIVGFIITIQRLNLQNKQICMYFTTMQQKYHLSH